MGKKRKTQKEKNGINKNDNTKKKKKNNDHNKNPLPSSILNHVLLNSHVNNNRLPASSSSSTSTIEQEQLLQEAEEQIKSYQENIKSLQENLLLIERAYNNDQLSASQESVEKAQFDTGKTSINNSNIDHPIHFDEVDSESSDDVDGFTIRGYVYNRKNPTTTTTTTTKSGTYEERGKKLKNDLAKHDRANTSQNVFMDTSKKTVHPAKNQQTTTTATTTTTTNKSESATFKKKAVQNGKKKVGIRGQKKEVQSLPIKNSYEKDEKVVAFDPIDREFYDGTIMSCEKNKYCKVKFKMIDDVENYCSVVPIHHIVPLNFTKTYINEHLHIILQLHLHQDQVMVIMGGTMDRCNFTIVTIGMEIRYQIRTYKKL